MGFSCPFALQGDLFGNAMCAEAALSGIESKKQAKLESGHDAWSKTSLK